MRSIRQIYKAGAGPSSSHSMGPRHATALFLQSLPKKPGEIRVELYGSLAATGKGHLTDQAIESVVGDCPCRIIWKAETVMPHHPCALRLTALEENGRVYAERLYYSVGGGELADEDGKLLSIHATGYEHDAMDDVVRWCLEHQAGLWRYVEERETESVWPYLQQIWQTMAQAVERGLQAGDTTLPGVLQLKRRAQSMLLAAHQRIGILRDLNLLAAYALAVAEENGCGHIIVTAPTCGACGIVPAVMYYFERHFNLPAEQIVKALATAALFGSSIARRASISGAEIGCQGEVGTACAMAAAGAAQLLGGTVRQIEYAAEMALEHMLGLTCDPIAGLVQIPCIERNAFGAMRALECASYALSTDGRHTVSFDTVVEVMKETGIDLQAKYKETALGGLADRCRSRLDCQ